MLESLCRSHQRFCVKIPEEFISKTPMISVLGINKKAWSDLKIFINISANVGYSSNNLQSAYTAAEQLLPLHFVRKTLSELSFRNPFMWIFCGTSETAPLLCLPPYFKINFATLKEISLFKTRTDHEGMNSGALKKGFHISLITTGHSADHLHAL